MGIPWYREPWKMEWSNEVSLKMSMKFHVGGVGMLERSSMSIEKNGLWDDGGSA